MRQLDFLTRRLCIELVEETPQLLPLSGAPRLIVLGREVRLGSGYADLLGVEPSGRIVIIEIKLAGNAEARRAVVAQVLAYAAFLHRIDPTSFEREVLASHLQARGHQGLLDAVASSDQEGSFDTDAFASDLAESLSTGRFRLVFVLDDAPEELVRLVGYLEAVTAELVIDLVTVSAYEVGGSRVLVPQRVDPERQPLEPLPATGPTKDAGHLIPLEEFAAEIDNSAEEHRPSLETHVHLGCRPSRRRHRAASRVPRYDRADHASPIRPRRGRGPDYCVERRRFLHLTVAERFRAASPAEHRTRGGAHRADEARERQHGARGQRSTTRRLDRCLP